MKKLVVLFFVIVLTLFFLVTGKTVARNYNCDLQIHNATNRNQDIFVNGRRVHTAAPGSSSNDYYSCILFRVVSCGGGDTVSWTTGQWEGIILRPEDKYTNLKWLIRIK